VKVQLLVLQAWAAGGTARTVINQANALATTHDVEIVSVLRRSGDPHFPVDPRVRLTALVDPDRPRRAARFWAAPSTVAHPKDRGYRYFSRATDVALIRYLRGLEGGVVIGTRPALNLAIARWAPDGVVRVAQEHMHLLTHRRRLRADVHRYLRRMDAVATLTERDAADYRELLGPRARVVAMPNGVEIAATHVSAQDTHAVIAHGRLVPQKAFDRLVTAFAAVADRHPTWTLTIFGDGPLRSDLEQQVRDLGLTGRVRLPGFTREVATELGRSSVFAMSSRREGLPMSLLEAMGSGLAVVSFDCPTGPGDVITHGRDGLLVPNGDVDALAEALALVMDDTELRRSLAAEARTTALGYGTDQLAERWDALFRDLDERHRTGRSTRAKRHPVRYRLWSWEPLPRPARRALRRARNARKSLRRLRRRLQRRLTASRR
jgi:glycosyltransferase involved in cell wall biosynthesis